MAVVYSAFKDVALQFLGNLFEYFLVRSNKGKMGKDRSHLTVIGATSGDVSLMHTLRVSLLICLDWICSDLRSNGQERCLRIHHVSDGEGQCYTGSTGQFTLEISRASRYWNICSRSSSVNEVLTPRTTLDDIYPRGERYIPTLSILTLCFLGNDCVPDPKRSPADRNNYSALSER